MNRIFQRLLHVAGLCVALFASAPALAQITNVTDGTTSTSTCTSYTFSASGVLTFSPAGCLLAPPPPPATPVYSFTAGTSQVVETTATSTVTVRRSGSDLSAAGSVIVNYVPGTAVGGTHFNVTLPPFVSTGTSLQIPVTFSGAAAGVTTQEYSFTVYVVNASLAGGTSRSLGFSLLSPTGGTLGATASHTLTITSASPPPPVTGDVDVNGAAIPGSLPVGTYAASTLACEFIGQSPFPGAGGRSPCGGYDVAVANPAHPKGAYDCNVGMQPAGGNTITSATMFVFEDLKNGNTYIPGVDLRYPQGRLNAFMIKFTTGNAGEFPPIGGFVPPGLLGQYTFSFAQQGNRGDPANRFAALSTKPCDFDHVKFDSNNACYKDIPQGGGSMLMEIRNGGTPGPGTCTLAPNTTYYLSTRWETVGTPGSLQRGQISCQAAGGFCGTSLSVN